MCFPSPPFLTAAALGARGHRHGEGGGEERAGLRRRQGEERPGLPHLRPAGAALLPGICTDLGSPLVSRQADLNPLFNWNVKQLFLYLTAEYQTPNNKLNQVSSRSHYSSWFTLVFVPISTSSMAMFDGLGDIQSR